METLNLTNVNWFYCPWSVSKEHEYPDKEYSLDNLRAIQDYLEDGLLPSFDIADEKRFNIAVNYIEKREKELLKLFVDSTVEIVVDRQFDLDFITKGEPFVRDKIHTILICRGSDRVNNRVLHVEVIHYSDRNLYINVNNNPVFTGRLMSVVNDLNLEEVTSLRSTIIQPGIDSEPIHHQNLTTWSLKPLIVELMRRLSIVKTSEELCSGDHCHWCQHKPNCEEITKTKLEEINKMDGGELSIIQSVHTELETMSLSRLADVLDAEKSFKDAFERARAEAKRRAELGDVISNDKHTWFIGNGKKAKSWNEPDEIIARRLKNMKVIKDDIYPSKLITPAAALKLDVTEKQLGNLKKLISEIDGKSTLKQGENKQLSAEDMFADVAQNEKQVEEVKPSTPMSFL